MRPRTALAAAGALILQLAVVGLVTGGGTAAAAPAFQLPFPCGQTWNGDSNNSSVHTGYEIDFNRGSSAYADQYDTVVAAASGTVSTAAYQTSNGYGNLVKISHGNGWYSYYAHLQTMTVKAGQSVEVGQPIGTVGNTSIRNTSTSRISPHLHYETRENGTIRPAYFNGSRFGYTNANVTSRNCRTPYDPAGLCGNGYYAIDTARLGTKGHVNLLWNKSARANCVVTLKTSSVGTATSTSAYLQPSGSTRSTDSGSFRYYAGPVRRTAPSCIYWGGSTGGAVYNSPREHC